DPPPFWRQPGQTRGLLPRVVALRGPVTPVSGAACAHVALLGRGFCALLLPSRMKCLVASGWTAVVGIGGVADVGLVTRRFVPCLTSINVSDLRQRARLR